MHDDILRWTLTGELPDSNIVQAKDRLVEFVESNIREYGCVPVLDLDPQFTLDYSPDSETFAFMLSVYGIYTGDDSWETAGVMSGTKIMKSTTLDKSREFSLTVE
jgi:hypothetical protein